MKIINRVCLNQMSFMEKLDFSLMALHLYTRLPYKCSLHTTTSAELFDGPNSSTVFKFADFCFRG